MDLGYSDQSTQPILALKGLVILTQLSSFTNETSSVYFKLLEGMEQQGKRLKLGIELDTGLSDVVRLTDVEQLLRPNLGLVFLGTVPDMRLSEHLVQHNIHAVLVNTLAPDIEMDTVTPENFTSGAKLARMLLDLGHKNFLYLTDNRRPTLARRYLGFANEVLNACNQQQRCSVLPVSRDIFTDSELAESIKSVFSEPARKITAVVGYCDDVAVRAAAQLRNIGIQVPRQVSVAGFDNMPISNLSTPGLATVHFDWHQIGAVAVKTLYQRLSDPGSAYMLIQISGKVIERGSVCPAADEPVDEV